MPHYRTMLTSDNFMAADLWSEKAGRYAETIIEIVAVKKGEVVGEKGRKKGMPFLTMRSAKTGQVIGKPLGLNATNCETIKGIAGSPDVDKWVGLFLTLYVTKTDAGPGEKRDCIRIRPSAAKPPGPEVQQRVADKRAADKAYAESPEGIEMAKMRDETMEVLNDVLKPKPGDEFAFDPEETP